MFKNLTAGAWVGSEPTRYINPSDTKEVVGLYEQASAEDTKNAIAAAKVAFPAWLRAAIWERHVILKKAGGEIMARKEEIGETVRATQTFEFFAGETDDAINKDEQPSSSSQPTAASLLISSKSCHSLRRNFNEQNFRLKRQES